MAFVVIAHLSPEHKSALSEVIAKMASLPVAEAREGMPVEANHVYVIPPNTEMSIAEGRLPFSLAEEDSRRGQFHRHASLPHCPGGGGQRRPPRQVEAHHISLESDNTHLVLQVRDDGAGIPEEQAPEGLGLRIMRYRANLIDATLSRPPGRGSRDGRHLPLEERP